MAPDRRARRPLQANLTPMIDVTFLLIVFFVLVSQIVEVENVDLELPTPRDPVSELPGDQPRVVINVLPGPRGTAGGYRLGAHTMPASSEGLDQLARRLATIYRDTPGMGVNLRADQRTHYRWVEPVFRAISTGARLSGRDDVAGRVNLVLVREP